MRLRHCEGFAADVEEYTHEICHRMAYDADIESFFTTAAAATFFLSTILPDTQDGYDTNMSAASLNIARGHA